MAENEQKIGAVGTGVIENDLSQSDQFPSDEEVSALFSKLDPDMQQRIREGITEI